MGVGRDEDFDGFVRSVGPRLLRSAYLLTGDKGHAEDLVQATLMRAYTAWHAIDSAANSYAYAQRIMFTTFLRLRRRRRVNEALGTAADVAEPLNDRVEDRDQLRRALGQLPARMRAVVVLRFYEDLSVDQVAAVLDVTAGTVKSQTAKALARLRVSPHVATMDGN